MKRLAIIPARYDSSRFPGKPLADIQGKPMIQWVYESVAGSMLFDKVIVATDDIRIAKAVSSFGGEVRMTANTHRSGTDRCIEVVEKLNSLQEHYDLIVNIQGDEPGIQKAQIYDLIRLFDKPEVQIGTLVKKIEKQAEIQDKNTVKAVFTYSRKALYFSRYPVPYSKENEGTHYKHIGIYGFRNLTLLEIKKLALSALEKTESLEQLRWLENDFSIYIAETKYDSFGIDTMEDIEDFIKNIYTE